MQFNTDARRLMSHSTGKLQRVEMFLSRIEQWAASTPPRPLLVEGLVTPEEVLQVLYNLDELPVSHRAVCVPLSMSAPFGRTPPAWIPPHNEDAILDGAMIQTITSPMNELIAGRYRSSLEDGIPLEFRQNVTGPIMRALDASRTTLMQARFLAVLRSVAVFHLAAAFRGRTDARDGFERMLDLFPRAVVLGIRYPSTNSDRQVWIYATA